MKILFAHKDIRFLAVFSAIIISGIFIFLSLQKDHARRDERNFNMPTAINFYENPVKDAVKGEGYTTGTPPLPFLILKILTFGSYPNLFIYRMISFIFSVSSIILLINVLNKLSSGKAVFFISCLILFQPYFLKSALTFYTATYGIFFLVLFLYLYFKDSQAKKESLILGILSSAAILCQQVYLAIPFAYTLILGYNAFIKRKSVNKISLLLFYIPHIFPALLFVIWGGLTHDQPRTEILLNSSSFTQFISNLIPFKNITAILTISGFYVLPASIYMFKKVRWQYLIIFLIISILLTVFNQPVFTRFPEFNKVTGLVHRLIHDLSSFHPVLGEILRVVSISSFLMFLFILIKESGSVFSDFLIMLILALLGVFIFDFLLSERHLIPLIIVLFVTLYRFKINEIYYFGWIFIMMLMGCGYSIYWFNY